MDTFALLITIIGGINWLLVGLAQFDLVAWICGGPATIAARIIYTIVRQDPILPFVFSGLFF